MRALHTEGKCMGRKMYLRRKRFMATLKRGQCMGLRKGHPSCLKRSPIPLVKVIESRCLLLVDVKDWLCALSIASLSDFGTAKSSIRISAV